MMDEFCRIQMERVGVCVIVIGFLHQLVNRPQLIPARDCIQINSNFTNSKLEYLNHFTFISFTFNPSNINDTKWLKLFQFIYLRTLKFEFLMHSFLQSCHYDKILPGCIFLGTTQPSVRSSEQDWKTSECVQYGGC